MMVVRMMLLIKTKNKLPHDHVGSRAQRHVVLLAVRGILPVQAKHVEEAQLGRADGACVIECACSHHAYT